MQSARGYTRILVVMRTVLVLVFLLSLTFGGYAYGEPVSHQGFPDRVLRVAVVEDPPMIIKHSDGSWSGFTVELWRHIAKELKVEYELKEMPFEEIEYALKARQVDLSIAPFYETVERLRVIDFSTPIGMANLAVAVPAKRDAHPFLATMKAFFSWGLVEIAILFVIVLVITGFIFWFVERDRNPDHFGGNRWKGIGTGVYWAGSTLVSGMCTGVSLKSAAGKIIGLTWILAGAIAFGALTASLASSLIDRQQRLNYTYDPGTLRKMHLGVVAGTTQAAILERMDGRYTMFRQTDEGLQAVLAGKVDGFFSNERRMAYEKKKYKGQVRGSI